MPKKGGLGQFIDLGGVWLSKKEGGSVFKGVCRVDTPMRTVNLPKTTSSIPEERLRINF